jgi:hypothetical protein
MGLHQPPTPQAGWSAIGEGRYAPPDGGEYGHVKVRISPSPPGCGLQIHNELTTDAIPKAFLHAVAEGLMVAAMPGIRRGFLVADIRIDLIDGSYHDVDSSEKAFMIAAVMAFRDAMHNAGRVPDASGDDWASAVRQPRHPRPAPRSSAVALPEPDEAVDSDLD